MRDGQKAIFHCSLDVRSALRKPNRNLRGMMKHADGRLLTPDEVRDVLMDRLAEGYERLPFGPCEGFDKKTGCPGHRNEVRDVE